MDGHSKTSASQRYSGNGVLNMMMTTYYSIWVHIYISAEIVLGAVVHAFDDSTAHGQGPFGYYPVPGRSSRMTSVARSGPSAVHRVDVRRPLRRLHPDLGDSDTNNLQIFHIRIPFRYGIY